MLRRPADENLPAELALSGGYGDFVATPPGTHLPIAKEHSFGLGCPLRH